MENKSHHSNPIQPEILKQWLLKIRENKNGDGG